MPKTTRCPHCFSPRLDGGICRTCGGSLDTPPEQPLMEGLERTGLIERVPRTADAAAPDSSAKVDTATCQACGLANPAGRALCLACGQRLVLASAAE